MWKRLSSIQLDAMLTTDFSERVTYQDCGRRLLRRAVNWRAAVGVLDEPATGSDSLCTT